MARVVVDEQAIERQVRAAFLAELDQLGREAKAFVIRNTPYKTGYARKSIYYVVLDERGVVVAGDSADANGVAVPRSFPGLANGTLRVIVGANAPYYIWIEIGARGRRGHQALARASDHINSGMQRWYREQRAGA